MSRPTQIRPRTHRSVAAGEAFIAEATANELVALLAENSAMQSRLTSALLRRQRDECQSSESHRAAKWITVKEASERSALSARFFYKRAEKPGFNWARRLAPRSIRVDANALDAFMRAKERR